MTTSVLVGTHQRSEIAQLVCFASCARQAIYRMCHLVFAESVWSGARQKNATRGRNKHNCRVNCEIQQIFRYMRILECTRAVFPVKRNVAHEIRCILRRWKQPTVSDCISICKKIVRAFAGQIYCVAERAITSAGSLLDTSNDVRNSDLIGGRALSRDPLFENCPSGDLNEALKHAHIGHERAQFLLTGSAKPIFLLKRQHCFVGTSLMWQTTRRDGHA